MTASLLSSDLNMNLIRKVSQPYLENQESPSIFEEIIQATNQTIQSCFTSDFAISQGLVIGASVISPILAPVLSSFYQAGQGLGSFKENLFNNGLYMGLAMIGGASVGLLGLGALSSVMAANALISGVTFLFQHRHDLQKMTLGAVEAGLISSLIMTTIGSGIGYAFGKIPLIKSGIQRAKAEVQAGLEDTLVQGRRVLTKGDELFARYIYDGRKGPPNRGLSLARAGEAGTLPGKGANLAEPNILLMEAQGTGSKEGPSIPEGYAEIPGGTFKPGNGKKEVTVSPFLKKRTPVTNDEWKAVAQRLEGDRVIILKHDPKTGETKLLKADPELKELIEKGLKTKSDLRLNLDQGDVMMNGSIVMLKMTDNPSQCFDDGARIFSSPKQPVLVSHFHSLAWCQLESERLGVQVDLPTDVQEEFVASNGGKFKYGTETGELSKDGRKLAHVDEYHDGRGTTVAVDDPRYEQELPFGIQTTGNVWRWTRFNPNEQYHYGLRGGSWLHYRGSARAAFRRYYLDDRYDDVGFSPVVVLQD